LIPELAFLVGIGLGRELPGGLLQLLYQTTGLAGHDDELATEQFVGLHRFPAVETGIGAGEDLHHYGRQRLKNGAQVRGNLRTAGPVAVAQLSGNELAGLRDKG
jgi:hypothetical protein